ncbi:MAG: LytTR family transcriptional regulator [Bacteroidales bacterium]|nr:LytTR family transcriptional regulator [Bacteroidales bacterium]
MEQKRTVAEKALFIKSGPTIKRVLSSEILYVQCEGNVSRLNLKDGTELVCVRLLKLFEEDLSGAGFIRINHNMLVNLAEITEIRYINARKRQVVLSDEVVLDVSYRKWKSVKEALLGRK